MPVAPGTRFGPYEITALLGSGGMGEVYRARDTRLDRKVAIKVLPSGVASDPQFRLRLEREAKAISSLNHPHICTLYDIGHENGSDYLVMELLEGDTLADRIARGPLPADEVLRYGTQIAEALDKAHRQGIVHRDLKPGNIMLTKSGAKLLDFGLAKNQASGLGPRASVDETEHKALTAEGTIVGTFQYMAPEQLEGIDADPRTDIFALGAVLYEMATAKRAFEGKTRTSLIAAIVSGRPTPVSQLQPLAPPALEHVIERCLEKEPADRWQSAHDVAEELKWISAKGSQAGIAAPITSRRRVRERVSWLLNIALIVAAAALTWAVIEFRREKPRVVVTSIVAPEKTSFAFDYGGGPAISPNGDTVVFPAMHDGTRMLYIRPLNGAVAQPLSGTEDGSFPFWSPDSRSIGFFASGKLKRIDAAGGAVQTLADAPQGRGGSWSREGFIVFVPSLSTAIFKVPDSGGAAAEVTHLSVARTEATHRWPFFLPDGRHFIYMKAAAAAVHKAIALASIDGGDEKVLVESDSNAVYAAGHLIYVLDRSLLARPIDLKSFRTGRDATPIAEDVAGTGRWDAFFSSSDDAKLVYQSGSSITPSVLTWFDMTGKSLGVVGKPADYLGLALSHDGRRLAVTINDPVSRHGDIWVEDIARQTVTRLTFEPLNEWNPIWSPDDSMILYTANIAGPGRMMMRRSSGTGSDEPVIKNVNVFDVGNDWSPDGKSILFQRQGGPGSGGWDLFTYSLEDHQTREFLATPFLEYNASFSPDGRWVAYQSDEAGPQQVYVLPFTGRGGKWQISTEGGTRPRWSRDGKRLFYIAPNGKLMVVPVETKGEEFSAGTARELVPVSLKAIAGITYDLSPDGKRVLLNTPIEQTAMEPITLVQNWTARLKK